MKREVSSVILSGDYNLFDLAKSGIWEFYSRKYKTVKAFLKNAKININELQMMRYVLRLKSFV